MNFWDNKCTSMHTICISIYSNVSSDSVHLEKLLHVPKSASNIPWCIYCLSWHNFANYSDDISRYMQVVLETILNTLDLTKYHLPRLPRIMSYIYIRTSFRTSLMYAQAYTRVCIWNVRSILCSRDMVVVSTRVLSTGLLSLWYAWALQFEKASQHRRSPSTGFPIGERAYRFYLSEQIQSLFPPVASGWFALRACVCAHAYTTPIHTG